MCAPDVWDDPVAYLLPGGGRKPVTMRPAVITALASGAKTATVLARETGFERSNISHMLANDEAFVATEKVGKGVLYQLRPGCGVNGPPRVG